MDRKKKKCSFGKNRMGAIQSRIESTSSNSTTIGEMLADSTFDLHLLSNKDSKVWVRDIRRQVGLCPYWLNRDPCWSVRSRLVVPFSFCFRLSLEATGTLIPFFLLLFIKLQPPLFLFRIVCPVAGQQSSGLSNEGRLFFFFFFTGRR